MACPRCGVASSDEDLFCSSCGAHLRSTHGYPSTKRRGRVGTVLVVVFNLGLLGGAAALVYATLERYRGGARAATVEIGTPRLLGEPILGRSPDLKAPPTGRQAAPAVKQAPPAVKQVHHAPHAGREPRGPSKVSSKKAGRLGPGPGKSSLARAKGPLAKPATKAIANALERIDRHHAALNAQSVKMVVRHYLPQISACYTRATKRGRRIGGMIEIRLVIRASGKVSASRVHSNSTGAEGLGACIAATMRRWKFPRPIGGEVVFIYPFVFSSS